jgi:hypothetical protein
MIHDGLEPLARKLPQHFGEALAPLDGCRWVSVVAQSPQRVTAGDAVGLGDEHVVAAKRQLACPIASDRQQPGAESAGVPQPAEADERLDQRLLSDVLGVHRATDLSPAGSEQGALMPARERGERVRIAPPGARPARRRQCVSCGRSSACLFRASRE